MSIPPTRSYRRSPEEWAALGAYASPFTDGGVQFEPVGGQSAVTDFRLHETGFMARRPHWNYQNVFSPFWRLYYSLESGHGVVFAEKEVKLGPERARPLDRKSHFLTAWKVRDCLHEPNRLLALHRCRRSESGTNPGMPIGQSKSNHRALLVSQSDDGNTRRKMLGQRRIPVDEAVSSIISLDQVPEALQNWSDAPSKVKNVRVSLAG